MSSSRTTPLDLYLRSLNINVPVSPVVYNLPLQQFQSGIEEQTINISLQSNAYVLYFQNNPIENNLFLSCYGSNQNTIFFGSFRCVFGSYINLVPETPTPFPYLFFFHNPTQNIVQNITFESLNNGVQLYAKPRN